MTGDPAARAIALVGTRFRPNGRDPCYGLDCVGLVAAAHGIAAEAGFAMRGGTREAVVRAMIRHGFVPVGDGGAGDVLVMAPGGRTFHLGIVVEGGTVHVDARLGRVAMVPGVPPWPVIGRWRRG